MAKQSKKPADLNRLAAAIVGDATDEPAHHGENGNGAGAPAGRNGGLKGGAARAAALSPERRAEIARKAAQARWQKARSAD